MSDVHDETLEVDDFEKEISTFFPIWVLEIKFHEFPPDLGTQKAEKPHFTSELKGLKLLSSVSV